jgi:ComF family protein
MLKDFFSLLFPVVCLSCGKSLFRNESVVCTLCQYKLPKTNYHLQKENPVAKLFWGRVNVESATAYYSFAKGSKVQHLIHELKYKGQTEVGISIGKWQGIELMKSDDYNKVDVIMAVPLHKKKQRKRGYNQSEFFATGLSVSMKVPTDFVTLYRAEDSETQTKKTRFNRWMNVEYIFKLKDFSNVKGKHILLVDDVITTGATMEACIQALLEIPEVKVSVAVMAFASHS